MSHLKGASIRTVAMDIGKGIDTAYRRIVAELHALPHNNDVTLSYCNPKRFCGFLVVDGKFVAVKGYERKIPFIYGIDYLTHDIPICMLAPSENYQALLQFFTKLKNTGYELLALICDDNESIRMAARAVYPGVIVQLCHVHFLENIRRTLKVRSEETYRAFVEDLEEKIFDLPYLGQANLERHIRWRAPRHYDDPMKIATLQHIFHYSDLLTGYVKAENLFHNGCPKTTNLIESFNKQINGRLKTIQGFQSFQSAERWLSAWILCRRMTPFTDCRGKFRQLNGTYSLEKTRMKKFKLPKLF
ncbi:transposase [Candidatus Peregrinibacteria bacterium]|nr:transposase [Candidatus Peregrinibacteria bacterium]